MRVICSTGRALRGLHVLRVVGVVVGVVIGAGGAGGATALAQPANDQCTSPQTITEGSWPFSNLGATTSSPPPPAPSGVCTANRSGDVWFLFVAPRDGYFAFYTAGSNMDPVLAVHSGGCGGLSVLGCNDDTYGVEPLVVVRLVSGQVVRVEVSGYGPSRGAGNLVVEAADGYAFTYQGELTQGGVPASGTHTLRFTPFYVPADGVPVAEPITRSVTIAPGEGGRFTAELNFFNVLASLADVYIEIAVDGQTLSPRQRLAASPRAIFARLADRAAIADTAGSATSAVTATSATTATSAASVPWGGVSGVPANVSGAFSPFAAAGGGIQYTGGNVGIGRVSTGFKVDVYSASDANTLGATSGSDFGSVIANISAAVGGRNYSWISTGPTGPGGAGALVLRDVTGFSDRLIVNPSGNIGIGTFTTPQKLTVAGNVQANNVTVPSSGRFKEHVEGLSGALDLVARLEGVRFDWKPEFARERGFTRDLGFVAEDVARVLPEVVFRDEAGQVTGMDYSRLTAVLVEALKESEARRAREMRVKQGEIDDLRARVERLERAVGGGQP